MTTTTDTDALLAYAREHEPGLWKALTAPRTSYVDWKPSFEWDKTGRVPLPTAKQHVALEAWLGRDGYIFGRGKWDPSFDLLWWVEGKRHESGEGHTLAGAVLAALEAK